MVEHSGGRDPYFENPIDNLRGVAGDLP